MRERLRRSLFPLVAVALAAVVAVGLSTAAPSPADRSGAIAARLRCPVCQGVSVADSPSDTAAAIRDRIDELIAAGATDEEVYRHFIDRYGEWVLLEPPLDDRTWVLWWAPAGVTVAGTVVLVRVGRRRSAPPPVLTDDQRRSVAEALQQLEGRRR